MLAASPLLQLPSWWPQHLPNSYAPTHGWTLTWILVFAAILIIFLYTLLKRPAMMLRIPESRRRLVTKLLAVFLGMAAVLSVLTYHDFGLFRYGTYHNEWAVYHYYLGTKYADELGYTELYGATLVADQEQDRKYTPSSGELRDLNTGKLVQVKDVLAQSTRYKSLFSTDRWSEFVVDVAWFKDQFQRDRWSLILQDHGYNGTPVWSFIVGGLLTKQLSIRNPTERFILLVLDPLLLVAGLLCVGWAFGTRTALLLMVFVGTHYLMSWGHMKGVLFRTDFAMSVLMAVCCVKKGKYNAAGMLLGWGILSRVFPVFFLVGPIVRFFSVLAEERRIDKKLLGLLVSCGGTILFLVLGSIVYGGLELWQGWFQKITSHYISLVHWNIGYQPMVDVEIIRGVPELIDPLVHYAEEQGVLIQHIVLTWGVRALVLIPALYFAKFLKDHEALVYGFVFLFFLVAPAYYYYLILCVPFLFFAPDLQRPSHAVGLAYMFLTGIAGYAFFSGFEPLRESVVIFKGWKQFFPTYYYMSWMISGTAIYMVLLAAARSLSATAGIRQRKK
jgi:hypothetical protein